MLGYAGVYAGINASIVLYKGVILLASKLSWAGVAAGAAKVGKAALVAAKATAAFGKFLLSFMYYLLPWNWKAGVGKAYKAGKAAYTAAKSAKAAKATATTAKAAKGTKAITFGTTNVLQGGQPIGAAKAAKAGAAAKAGKVGMAAKAEKAAAIGAKAGKAAMIAMLSNPWTAAFVVALIIATIVVAVVMSNNKIFGNLGPLITDYEEKGAKEYENEKDTPEGPFKLDKNSTENKICNSMYGNENTYWEFGDRIEQVRTFVPNEWGKDSDKAALFYRRRGRSEITLCKNKCIEVDEDKKIKRCSINGYICSDDSHCYNGNFNDIILSDNGTYTKFLENNDRYKSKYDDKGNFLGFVDKNGAITYNRSEMIGNDYHFSIPTDPTTSPPSEHFTNTNKATSKDSHTIIDTNIKKIIDIGEKHRKCSETKKLDQYVSLNQGNKCIDQEDCHHGFDVPAGNNYRLMNSKDPRVWQYTTLNVLQPPPSRKTNDQHNKKWNVHGSDKTVEFGYGWFNDFKSKVCKKELDG